MKRMNDPMTKEEMQGIINRLMGLSHSNLVDLAMNLSSNVANSMMREDATEDQFGYTTMRVIDLSIDQLNDEPEA